MRRFVALVTIVVLAVGVVLPVGLMGAAQSGPFADVPDSHTFADDIEWLAATGITHGCNPPDNTLFCPDEAVTRGQMAAFLTRALDLTVSGPSFDDTRGHLFAEDISRLAAAGITRGCNPPLNSLFCPDEDVTRGEMAAFLTRGLHLPPAADQGFVDSDTVFRDDINSLAAAGITLGCNPPENTFFCPDDPVTRAQMAAFLRRGLEGTIPTTTTTSTSSTSSTTSPSSSTTTTQPGGDFDPFTIDGSGNDVIDFQIPGDVPALIDLTHDGESNFIIWSLDSNHEDIDLLVNEIGVYEGRRMAHGGWFGEPEPVRHLEVDADGTWSITARPLSDARRFGSLLTGSGDDVVLYTSSSPTMTSTHDGSSNFIIVGYLESGEYNDLIVNEIGTYNGQDVVETGTEILDITADGNWSLETP